MSQTLTTKTTAQPTLANNINNKDNINNNSNNNKNKSHNNRSKVWAYFKQCDHDTTKFSCNLCAAELLNTRGTTTILWNHLKFKHSIERNSVTTVTTNSSNKIINNNNNNNNYITATTNIQQQTKSQQHKYPILDNEENVTADRFVSTVTRFKSNATPPIMVHTKFKDMNSNNSKQLKFKHNNGYPDFVDDFSLKIASMKPLPSASLSQNLISRLNQLSIPVTRKLKFWNKKSFQVNQYDPSFKVIYLGNLGMHLWSKDESCLDKPLSTLWNNYLVNMKTEIVMRLTICNSGLKAITRQHGLTQYWSNRLVYCCSHKNYPRIFSWVYRHEGKKMRQELRCHAVLCPSPEKAAKMVTMLNQRLACALQEFKREKKSRGINLVNNNISTSSLSHNKLPRTIPLRRQILEKGSANFRPPLERSKSAPKLTSILEEDYDTLEEEEEEEEEEEGDDDDDDDDEDEENSSSEDKASHDVYEYQETFHERDEEVSDYGEFQHKQAEEEMNDAESNSLTTTLNEEASNTSYSATSDIKYSDHTTQNQQNVNTRLTQISLSTGEPIERICVEPNPDSECNKESSCTNNITAEDNLKHQQPVDHENVMQNEGHKLIINHHGDGSRSSANNKNPTITLRSSFKHKQLLETVKKTAIDCSGSSEKEEDDRPITVNNPKNNNTHHKNQQSSVEPTDADDNEDSSTHEIILPWSNLVIK